MERVLSKSQFQIQECVNLRRLRISNYTYFYFHLLKIIYSFIYSLQIISVPSGKKCAYKANLQRFTYFTKNYHCYLAQQMGESYFNKGCRTMYHQLMDRIIRKKYKIYFGPSKELFSAILVCQMHQSQKAWNFYLWFTKRD